MQPTPRGTIGLAETYRYPTNLGPPALIHTCRQIRAEARMLYYSSRDILTVTIFNTRTYPLRKWLAINSDLVEHITKLRIICDGDTIAKHSSGKFLHEHAARFGELWPPAYRQACGTDASAGETPEIHKSWDELRNALNAAEFDVKRIEWVKQLRLGRHHPSTRVRFRNHFMECMMAFFIHG